MHTLGYRFKPWTDAKSIADGAVDPRLPARDRARGRHRRAGSATTTGSSRADWSSADARWTVEVERTDTGETVELTCGFLFVCSGYYRYDRGLHARVPGHRALRRPGRPPAALARGPRLRRQARRRDRQRRHRGDAGPGDGRDGRARDDAAALADLRRLAARRRPDRQRRCAASCPRRRAYAIVRWKNVLLQMAVYQLSRRRPELVRKLIMRRGAIRRAAAPATTSTSTSSRATTPGTSASASSPTATSSRRSPTGSAEIVTDRIETFTETRRQARVRARSSRPTSSSPPPASTCSSSAACELTVDGEEVDRLGDG